MWTNETANLPAHLNQANKRKLEQWLTTKVKNTTNKVTISNVCSVTSSQSINIMIVYVRILAVQRIRRRRAPIPEGISTKWTSNATIVISYWHLSSRYLKIMVAIVTNASPEYNQVRPGKYREVELVIHSSRVVPTKDQAFRIEALTSKTHP